VVTQENAIRGQAIHVNILTGSLTKFSGKQTATLGDTDSE
jgi:hypothetical protein